MSFPSLGFSQIDSLGFFFQTINRPKATDNVLKSVRKYYPDSPIVLVGDGGVDLTEIAAKYKCVFMACPEKTGDSKSTHFVDTNSAIFWLNRIKDACEKIDTDWVMLLEDDVLLRGKPLAPHHAIAGPLGHYVQEDLRDEIRKYNPFFSGQYGACGGSLFRRKMALRCLADSQSFAPLIEKFPFLLHGDVLLTCLFEMCGFSFGPSPSHCETWENGWRESGKTVVHQFKENTEEKHGVVLMTSAILVSPNCPSYSNPVLRLQQYLYCLLRWAKSSAYGVVFCDNSGIKMNTEFLLHYYEAFGTKLEILLFKEEYDSRYYGFLEQRILQYAIQNSKLLKHETSFFKVTGRLFIENYDKINEEHLGDNMVIDACTDCENALDSKFFKIDHDNCLDFIQHTSEKEYESLTIEKLLSQKLPRPLVGFRCNPIIVGRGGGPPFSIRSKDYDDYGMKEASNLSPSIVPELF